MSRKTIISRPCYTLAVSNGGRKAELTMYGEIVESRPVDWWTGEEIKGEFIVLADFLKDLETIADAEELYIHLNSVGGDAYSSFAIHNRLRELRAEKTCTVDGVAMSGGSLIMCACDHVKVNPSSIVMIHDCWRFVWDRANSSDLRKMADEMDVTNNAQAEIYARKTGRDLDDIRAMMKDTKYMSGREAVELGFADEVIEDAADPEVSVSEDRRTLYACGRQMRIAAMEVPEGIRTTSIAAEETPQPDDDTNLPETSGKKGSDTMTLEEFRKENPEAAAALLAEAQADASAAVAAERQRIADIDAVAALYDDDTVRAAKYGDTACTAQEMCYRAAVESVKLGKKYMADVNADYQESGAAKVAPAHAEEEDKPLTNEDLVAAGRAAAAALKKEV